MRLDATHRLADLQANFRANSSTSMPIAGTVYWLIVGAASLVLDSNTVAFIVLIGSGMILPAGLIFDRARGLAKHRPDATGNPLTPMFLKGTAVVVLMWPLVILAAQAAQEPNLIVLGGAVLMALVWIPYGSAADDPVGMHHAVGRPVAAYAAYLLAPEPYVATAISAVVVLSYAYTFLFMKRPS
ncbi:DUF7010 family protein [Sphingomonas sp. CJ99]